MLCVFVFFFKQKTAYELRISDWSSDVCSSDFLEAGLVAVLLVLRQEVEVLDAAAAFEDRVPDRVAVLRLVDEQGFQMRVADREAARERLVRVDVRRDRLDACAGAAADDLNRPGWRDCHLSAEPFTPALLCSL